MDESNLDLCLIRIRSDEHGTKLSVEKIRTILRTHRTPGPPVEVGVVRDHGGCHRAADLDIRVGEDVAASQPPASAPHRPLVLGVKPDLVTPAPVTRAEVTGLGGYLGIVQRLSLL